MFELGLEVCVWFRIEGVVHKNEGVLWYEWDAVRGRANVAHTRQSRPDVAHIRQSRPNVAHIRQSRPNVAHIRQSSPNVAHTRQSRPDSGLDVQVKALQTISVVPSSLASGNLQGYLAHKKHSPLPLGLP